MYTVLYFLLVMIYIGLLFWGIKLIKKSSLPSASNVLLLVIAGLIYDNGILASGSYIGEGKALLSLNYLRYLFHVLVTPTLILFSWKTLTQVNVGWTKRNWLKYTAYLLTFATILYEIYTQLVGLRLKPQWDHGVLSYEPSSGMGVPVMIIIVTLVLLMTALLLWKKQKWPWMLLGILVMGIGNLLSIWVENGPLMNSMELILMVSLLATKQFQES